MHSGGAVFFSVRFFKIGKSILARAWGNAVGDSAVRRIFASSAMFGARRAPRLGLDIPGAGLLH
jgi:hypothetical protein